MCLIVFLLYMFQSAFRSTVYELFFVGDRIFAPPAVWVFRMFSLAVAPCLVPVLVRAVFVISCARYVITALFTRLFLRLYAVPFGKLVMARLRTGITEPVFCYRFEILLACPVVWVILVIPVIFSDMFFFLVTFLWAVFLRLVLWYKPVWTKGAFDLFWFRPILFTLIYI